ncbi:bifunctional riboflavin kinase/FAD synthetase [Alkalihalobacillus oceani]|uniref:Riboflavin biosynthesis protein n=1 Tax=Halalkalibacter oceani TaxID=1653776 RepID=A0A9X2IMQ0_9BACI|nr:bifunctional riboflavin kinase/FAD synthetase [Halalkalibacter oceani]MCM3713240.1 bifunctional riboflavin kinase/FAD synthetase [Halalkalibacter oceani]
MDTIYLHHPIEASTLKLQPTVMALGYFDGVHRGHQQVMAKAKEVAHDLGVTTSVMTFHPHPQEVLRKPKTPLKYITPLPDKVERIESLGIDTLYVVQFTEEFARLTPQQFVDHYLIALDVVHVVAGFDFTYGSLGKGTMETLPFHARDRFSYTIVDKFEENQQKVSSTVIRELLAEGRVQDVPLYLGMPYTVKGQVVDGEKRGRTIGFPTANVALGERYLLPQNGVYAVTMRTADQLLEGVCNIGVKPTFHQEGAAEPTIEVHLFDFSGDLYGAHVEVEFHLFIRPEQKFAGVEALVSQIEKDKQQAIDYFRHNSS